MNHNRLKRMLIEHYLSHNINIRIDIHIHVHIYPDHTLNQTCIYTFRIHTYLHCTCIHAWNYLPNTFINLAIYLAYTRTHTHSWDGIEGKLVFTLLFRLSHPTEGSLKYSCHERLILWQGLLGCVHFLPIDILLTDHGVGLFIYSLSEQRVHVNGTAKQYIFKSKYKSTPMLSLFPDILPLQVSNRMIAHATLRDAMKMIVRTM